MSGETLRPARPGASTSGLIAVTLAAIFSAAPLHAAEPPIAQETGIVGRVLRGPVEPGPSIAGEPDEAPFRAVFHVMAVDRVVARFESDEQGCFEVALPPGEYVIVADKSAPILFPQQQKKPVTVPVDDYAVVTLKFDTGMR